jgi:hypothetical protein
MYTSLDVIEYLMSTTGGGAQDQEHRVLRQALFHAYRDLVTARDWRWYHTVDEEFLDPTSDVTTITLPWGCQSVDSIQSKWPTALADYISPTEFERLLNTPNPQLASLVWTISPSKFSPDRFDVRVLNGSRFDTSITLTYRRRPRDLICTGWEPGNRAGTLSWNNNEISGVGTSFSNQMLGCIVRVSGDDSYHPESLAGMRPYRDEGLIYRVANSTTLYAWSPAPGVSYASTKYVITDYLDISPGMYTALLSGTEVWLARLTGKNIEGAFGVYGRDLRLAFEADAMACLSGRKDGSGWYYSWWYLRPGNDLGTGGGGMGGPNATGTCPIKPDAVGGDAFDPGDGTIDGGSADTVFGACG